MPTVLRKDGFRVMIYPHDHEPAHVHVWHGDAQVIVTLGQHGDGPRIRTYRDASRKMRADVWRLIAEHNDFLLTEWERRHG